LKITLFCRICLLPQIAIKQVTDTFWRELTALQSEMCYLTVIVGPRENASSQKKLLFWHSFQQVACL
jgi:hypothetical protein